MQNGSLFFCLLFCAYYTQRIKYDLMSKTVSIKKSILHSSPYRLTIHNKMISYLLFKIHLLVFWCQVTRHARTFVVITLSGFYNNSKNGRLHDTIHNPLTLCKISCIVCKVPCIIWIIATSVISCYLCIFELIWLKKWHVPSIYISFQTRKSSTRWVRYRTSKTHPSWCPGSMGQQFEIDVPWDK